MGTDQSHRLLVGENLVELEFMVKWLGMSEMEAIIAATSRAAECIERPELGALVRRQASQMSWWSTAIRCRHCSPADRENDCISS